MSHKLEWHHSRPKEYYPKCVKMYGTPDAISVKRNGFALWLTRGLFSEHLLRDEDVKHCVPRPHHDYFYSSVKFYVPADKVCDVLKISGSLFYDGLKKYLTARCGGIGANYATLYLAMMVAEGKLSIKEVKSDDMYPKMIRGELIPHKKLHKIMYKMKVKNNKRYAKQLKDDFATYAFKKCHKSSSSKTKKRTGRKKKSSRSSKTRKSRGGSSKSKPRNNRDELCSQKNPKASHDWTSCCPHMSPDGDGHYRATNEKNIIEYKGHKYELWTCCQACADNMKKIAKNEKEFTKKYVHGMEGTTLLAKNQHTGVMVQKLHRVE